MTAVRNEKMDFRDRDLTDLLQQTAAGDKAAFAELYSKTGAKLYGIARRICASDETAKEALQESYLLIWRNAASFNASVASPVTWMARIVRNKSIDIRRLQSERISVLGVELDVDMPARDHHGSGPSERYDALRRLNDCLNGLPPERREMVLLAYYSGATREEIGQKFNRPANTVKTLLRRSLGQLKECIDGNG